MAFDDTTHTTPQPEPKTAGIKRNMRRMLKEFDDVIVVRKFRESLNQAYVNRHMYAEWHEPTEDE